jgi:hypothetical protein
MVNSRFRRCIGLRFAAVPLVVVLAAVTIPVGCGSTTITPPPTPERPVTVFVAISAYHAAIALPVDAAGRYQIFTLGDADFYARGRQGPGESVAALTIPTESALGTAVKWVGAGAGPGDAARRLAVDRVVPVVVDAADAERLRVRLDERIAAHTRPADPASPREFLGSRLGYVFAYDPHGYHLHANCNHIVAGWLREMGCRVDSPITADFEAARVTNR